MSQPIGTQLSIEDLKRQWKSDPCWDIEDTEGFEAHKQELYIYRLETENDNLRTQVAEFNTFKRVSRQLLGLEK